MEMRSCSLKEGKTMSHQALYYMHNDLIMIYDNERQLQIRTTANHVTTLTSGNCVTYLDKRLGLEIKIPLCKSLPIAALEWRDNVSFSYYPQGIKLYQDDLVAQRSSFVLVE